MGRDNSASSSIYYMYPAPFLRSCTVPKSSFAICPSSTTTFVSKAMSGFPEKDSRIPDFSTFLFYLRYSDPEYALTSHCEAFYINHTESLPLFVRYSSCCSYCNFRSASKFWFERMQMLEWFGQVVSHGPNWHMNKDDRGSPEGSSPLMYLRYFLSYSADAR